MKKKNLLVVTFLLLLYFSYGQNDNALLDKISNELSSGTKTVSQVLTDTALMRLHSLTAFREIIKKNASSKPVDIVPSTEPGLRTQVNVTVTDKAGNLVKNILVYFYHTSDKGWYSDTGVHIRAYEGDHRHSRLFGYVRTDNNGKFTISTIRPNGYPKSDFAAHIHIQAWKEDGAYLPGMPGELQFDDDIRMTAQRRQKSIAEGFLIAKNSGTKENPVYNYTIILK